jgi:hypothetical protein
MKHIFTNENGDVLYSCEFIHGLKTEIKKSIKLHLVYSRNGYVFHYINDDLVQRYSNNPKNGKASLEVNKGTKTYFKPLS